MWHCIKNKIKKKKQNKQKAKNSVPEEPSKWVFKRLKSMSFGGLRPLDPHQGRCPWTPCRGGQALRSLTISFFFSTTKFHLWFKVF